MSEIIKSMLSGIPNGKIEKRVYFKKLRSGTDPVLWAEFQKVLHSNPRKLKAKEIEEAYRYLAAEMRAEEGERLEALLSASNEIKELLPTDWRSEERRVGKEC